MCWWDDLIVGQSVRFCLRNSYNCLSNEQWFHATIVEVIPDDEDDDVAFTAKDADGSSGRNDTAGVNDAGKTVNIEDTLDTETDPGVRSGKSRKLDQNMAKE